MKHLLLSLVLLGLTLSIMAQETRTYRRYATQKVTTRLDTELSVTDKKINKDKEKEIKKFTVEKERSIQYRSVVIPVVFHFLYTQGKDVVYEKEAFFQLDALNRDFSDSIVGQNYKANKSHPAYQKEGFDRKESKISVSFCLAEGSKKELGIVKQSTKVAVWSPDHAMKSKKTGGSDPWDTEKYLNVWVVHLPDTVGGYAQMPGGLGAYDGIVIDYRFFGAYYYARKPYNQGRTLSHLVGSYLGLHELWDEDTPCGDDEVDDTPIHNAPNYGPLNNYKHISTCDGYPVEMTMNIMDATDDASAFMFTAGQKKRIQTMLAKGGPREKLGQGGSLCQKAEPPKKLAEIEVATLAEIRQLTILAYPNPTNERFILALSPPAAGTCEIQILNFSGRLMSTQQLLLDEGHYQTQIETQSWAPGLYLIHCRMNGQTVNQTISVVK
jgi:hypothetical protein